MSTVRLMNPMRAVVLAGLMVLPDRNPF